MSDKEGSPWDRLLNEIGSPWDWVAAGAGGAIGAGVAIALGGGDLGAATGAGALTGVTVRKALVASSQKRILRRRAKALRFEINRHPSNSPSFEQLLDKLERERGLWESGAINNEEFGKQLDLLIGEYRALFLENRVLALPAAAAAHPGGEEEIRG